MNHPKASILLQAMFGGMNGGGGAGMPFEDEEMDDEPRPSSASSSTKAETSKPAETKPDPKANLTPTQRDVCIYIHLFSHLSIFLDYEFF